jgi:membrane-associated phospholipid phosphatase
MTFTELYKENRSFIWGVAGFVILLLLLIVATSKADGFFLLNPLHLPFLDTFFIYYTNFGDGFFCVALALLLFLFRKKYLSLMVFITYAISGIIAQVLKYFILEGRPAIYLKNYYYPYFIDHVTLHNYHAFPSGHTASAFAMAAVLAFYVHNKNYSFIFLALAILVGYSRIYLGQHFPDDVLIGAILGFLTSLICWKYFDSLFQRWTKETVRNY